MAVCNEVQSKGIFIGRLNHNSDLLEELTSLCRDKNIGLGHIEAIGAVSRAQIGFYDQSRQEYRFTKLDKNLEITSLIGNISIRDGEPMVHAHLTLADAQGSVYGGHLAPETIVFACEFIIHAYEGPRLCRLYDGDTGLPLWKI